MRTALLRRDEIPRPMAPAAFEPPGLDFPLDAVELEHAAPTTILRLALEKWGQRMAMVTSFQAEGMVLLDMAMRIRDDVRVITLDTGRLPQETYAMIDMVRERYDVDVEIHLPNALAVQHLVKTAGPNLFYDSVESRLACCHVRKVEPLKRALSGLDAWVTGLRREQSPSRAKIRKVEIDRDHGAITKLNPLADWTQDQVEEYTTAHNVPRHPLYAKGFPSIGCAPCTRAVEPGEDARAGRWWWESDEHKECGLHLPQLTGSEAQAPAETSARPRLRVVQ